MDLWRKTTWLLALTLLPLALPADYLQDANAYCQYQLRTGAPYCHLQPCPCGPAELSLKRFEGAPDRPALCACTTPQARRHQVRQQAVEACNEYRHTQRQSCFISRDDCPRGFKVLAEFSDDTGNRFTACRDGRHEQRTQKPSHLRGAQKEELLAQYDQLIASLESQRIAPPQLLPETTIDTLSGYFPGFPLNRLSLKRTRALSQGCFTDCMQIFCADDEQITEWTDPDNPRITRNLLHQIVHGERCEREGGRERFIIHWFQHLPDDIQEKLLASEPIDAERIHFAMYMESHANIRATSLCRRLPTCRKE
ncbi:MAG: hypothetical protein PVF13_02440 [Chromatiales bacterium]|jgi:hypothetical protein